VIERALHHGGEKRRSTLNGWGAGLRKGDNRYSVGKTLRPEGVHVLAGVGRGVKRKEKTTGARAGWNL